LDEIRHLDRALVRMEVQIRRPGTVAVALQAKAGTPDPSLF
jgi:hypothetical protein